MSTSACPLQGTYPRLIRLEQLLTLLMSLSARDAVDKKGLFSRATLDTKIDILELFMECVPEKGEALSACNGEGS